MSNNHSPKALQTPNENNFLELLGDMYIDAILSLTSIKECSAVELSRDLKIPLTTVYRKLRLLEDSGLIENVKIFIDCSGNEEKYYTCLISEAAVNFQNGKFFVSIKKNQHSDKITRLWKRSAKTKVDFQTEK